MQPKKLTGWLIVFIVWIGLFGVMAGIRNLGEIEAAYKPLMAEHPSLRGAVMVFQLLMGVGTAYWAYAAWVLYRREPGSLGRARTCFVVGTLLRVGSAFCIPLFGGLPAATARGLVTEAVPLMVVGLCVCGAWYLYLARSARVRELYADS